MYFLLLNIYLLADLKLDIISTLTFTLFIEFNFDKKRLLKDQAAHTHSLTDDLILQTESRAIITNFKLYKPGRRDVKVV